MMHLAVLGSTRGTDMQAIIDAIDDGRLDARIEIVISNRKHAGILEKARVSGIPWVYLPAMKGMDRESYDQTVSQALERYQVDLILLIGYMRIVSPRFCRRWEDRLVNVHPSLLPEFAGGMDEDVHQAVLDAGKQETGCTVHLVTEEVDGGPILLQKRCRVEKGETQESLKKKVQRLEGEALIEVVERFERSL